MQVNLDLASTQLETDLNLLITHALNVSHNHDAAKRIFQGLNSCLQLTLEPILIQASLLAFLRNLLLNIGIVIHVCLLWALFTYMIDNRVMGDTHQPSPKFLVINLLPVLPELDEHFLGNVLGIFLNPQAI